MLAAGQASLAQAAASGGLLRLSLQVLHHPYYVRGHHGRCAAAAAAALAAVVVVAAPLGGVVAVVVPVLLVWSGAASCQGSIQWTRRHANRHHCRCCHARRMNCHAWAAVAAEGCCRCHHHSWHRRIASVEVALHCRQQPVDRARPTWPHKRWGPVAGQQRPQVARSWVTRGPPTE